jgi:cytochrome c oxidase subunit 2
MKVDLYERIWMWAAGLMLAFFFGTLANASVREGMHPPSHVETIDPRAVFRDPRFSRQGLSVDGEGRLHVTVIGLTFVWMPAELELPADTPVTFHLTSPDVVHGYQIIGSNGQAMVVPGYVSRFTTRFPTPGEYLIACNEYCGIGHHAMAGKLRVVPAAEWKAPAGSAVTAGAAEAGAATGAANRAAGAAGGTHAAH